MAERAQANRGKRSTNPQRRGKGNGARPAAPSSGHNSSALEEGYRRWLPKIEAASAAYEKAAEAARQKKGALGQLYEAAERDGLNRKGFKEALADLKRDPLDVVAEQNAKAHIFRIKGSVLVEQYEMFPIQGAPKPVNPF